MPALRAASGRVQLPARPLRAPGTPVAGVTAKPQATAVRVLVRGDLGHAHLAAAVVQCARHAGVMGWVRQRADGALWLHLEGAADKVQALTRRLAELDPNSHVASVEVQAVAAEGHEQFAQRGISAGAFVVQEHLATAHHFDLRLEVGGVMRSWALPKGPSLDPAVKRLAVEVDDHSMTHNSFEGKLQRGGVIVWDRGTYEQGGRVPWPEALRRGHAVFVLNGQKLHGGFVLQRTRRETPHGRAGPGAGAGAQWLLIKRRDDHARPGSDVVEEQPRSVLSDHSLSDIIDQD